MAAVVVGLQFGDIAELQLVFRIMAMVSGAGVLILAAALLWRFGVLLEHVLDGGQRRPLNGPIVSPQQQLARLTVRVGVVSLVLLLAFSLSLGQDRDGEEPVLEGVALGFTSPTVAELADAETALSVALAVEAQRSGRPPSDVAAAGLLGAGLGALLTTGRQASERLAQLLEIAPSALDFAGKLLDRFGPPPKAPADVSVREGDVIEQTLLELELKGVRGERGRRGPRGHRGPPGRDAPACSSEPDWC